MFVCGLDPQKASDRNETNFSGTFYTNLDVYLNSLIGDDGGRREPVILGYGNDGKLFYEVNRGDPITTRLDGGTGTDDLLHLLEFGSGNFLPGSPKIIDELMGQPGFGATTVLNA